MAEVSVFQIYAMGEAAANVEFGIRELEVTPTEKMMGIDGDISDNQTQITAEGENASGVKYTQNINAGQSIKAEWLSRKSNQPFPPLVRRGEQVLIWRLADTDKFYWEEVGTDIRYRRGDIIALACISTIVNDDTPISPENSYWFEIDSLNGVIRLSTTALNGEVTSYAMELFTKKGEFSFRDGLDNFLHLISKDQKWHIENGAGTRLIMEAENTLLEMQGKFTLKAQNVDFQIGEVFSLNAQEYNVEAPIVTYQASTSYTITSANITLSGPLSSTGMGGGAGSASFQGEMNVTGATTLDGTLTNNGVDVTNHNHRGDSGGETGKMK